jgi:excisionase family DNA binding protein
VVLSFPDGRTVALPASLIDVMRASAHELAEGRTVTVLPSDAVLTPAEVAQMLGLSRPFVTQLLDDGEIPSERLPRSRHRRVRLEDVLAFAERRDRRREGRRRIADLVTDEGLPY